MKKLLFLGIILTLVIGVIPALEESPVAKTYDDITLPNIYSGFWLPDIWDLNSCPVTLSYTLDLAYAPNVEFTGDYSMAGYVGLFSVITPLAGARMSGFLADWDNPKDLFPTFPDLDNTQDIDDKFNLQTFPDSGSWDEQMYDVNCLNNTVGAPTFNPWNNYGIWFDRDGVDQWQDDMWGMVNGGTYNTLGVYDVEILYRKSSDNPTSKGTACATFFPDKPNSFSPTGYGIPTGFFDSSWTIPPVFYPAGISFNTDLNKMSGMKVRVTGSSGLGTIIVKNIEVTGCLTTPMKLKQMVMDILSALLPTGDKDNDHRIEKAIKQIEKSLDPNLWKSESTLTKKGKKVFEEEKKAVHELLKIKNGPASVQEVINYLLKADQTLAQIAIDEAIAAGGDSKEIAKANDEMAKAQEEIGKEDYDKAIEHYKNAWEHAQHAMKKATE